MQETYLYYFAAKVQSVEYQEHALDIGKVGKGRCSCPL